MRSQAFLLLYLCLIMGIAEQTQNYDEYPVTHVTGPSNVVETVTIIAIKKRFLTPRVQNISINQTNIFPQELITQEPNCFGKSILKISQKQELIVKANSPFVVFFRTSTASQHFSLKEYYGAALDSIVVNYLVEAELQNKMYVASIPLNLKCSSIKDLSYLRMKGNIHINFYDQHEQKEHQFNFIIICASTTEIQEFKEAYRPSYIIFWIFINLILQVYHGYNRNRSHLVLFLVYLMGSLLLTNQLSSYVYAFIMMVVIVMMQRKEGNINNKVFGLYNAFFLANSALIIYTNWTQNIDYQWNTAWIAFQNFIKIHTSMFVVLRLIKLHRFRYVFWYFILVSIFSVIYSGNNNIFFELKFKNPIDLTCLKSELFFPIMMLPISNYFTSLTSWMHRVVGISLTIASILPLNAAIKLMTIVLIGIFIFQIKKKDIRVLRHRY